MRDEKIFGIQHLLKCCAFFWGGGGALCRAFIIFGVRCHVRIFLWDTYFQNHGLNLGLILFRLGTRMGPAIEINLTWFRNSFEPFVKIGIRNLFQILIRGKFDSLEILSPNMSGVIWLR